MNRNTAPAASAPPAADLPTLFGQTACRWPLRRYQQIALEAFERARAAGRERTYLVLPPGAGKTVLGLEIARRLGRRTLVLCPNTAVQAQWLRQWQAFEPACVPAGADSDLGVPITVLTYQAICTFDAGAEHVDQQAETLRREAAGNGGERYAAGVPAKQQAGEQPPGQTGGNGHPPPRSAAEDDTGEQDGDERGRQEVASFRRRARALIARGGTREELLAMLHPHGRALVERMKTQGPWTLVLDECHHLLEMWGYLTRALIEEAGVAGGAFVVGLTATPPDEMNGREAALYEEIFGAADLVVPAPAAVKEGELAPYQELAYLTVPAEHEVRYIAAQQERFQALTLRLLDAKLGSVSFVAWVRQRAGERRLARHDGDVSAPGAPRVSWDRFEREEPALARAALRFFHHYQLPLPPDARLREPHRRPPAADDWVALIEDYCLGHLQLSADPRDSAAWEEIRRALPALGYVLTRRGIRASVSPVDRVLSLSVSKGAATLHILAAEGQALGERLRALVLCDYELAGREALAKLRGVLDPQAGSAALWLHILLSDPATAALDPILVTGRTVACGRRTAVDLCAWIETEAPRLRGSLVTERLFESAGANGAHHDRSWEDVVVVRPAHGWWQPRHYVPLLTRYFEDGRSRCLVGTRGLLGEGWDAKTVNVLVDLTSAGTSTAVHQMRGRSLRLDPTLPRKVADNWDVVCVAPDHPKGLADYARFVRKHQHYFALTAEGEIESGVSHVDPRLSPFGPPEPTGFGEINGLMLDRPQQRARAYEAWDLAEPYRNVEVYTVRVRFERSIGAPCRNLLRHDPPRGGPRGLVGLVARLLAIPAAEQLRPTDTVEDLAAALVEALRATGGIGERLDPEAIRVAVQSDGYYRCYLAGASPAESRLFAESLEELLAPLASPRYIIPRTVMPPPRSLAEALLLLVKLRLGRSSGSSVVYHAVPSYLAANRERVDAFRRAWQRYVDWGTPLYCQDPRAQAILQRYQGEDPFRFSSQSRTLWT